MSAVPNHKLTVDEYLAWAEGRPGRYQLYAGVVYAMAPERAAHAATKFAIQTALKAPIKRAQLNCHMLPDGMTVRVDRHTAHEPDALVYCGPQVPGDWLEIPNPVIVVEVLSPFTRHVDAALKLAGYFSIATVQHYLMVNAEESLVVHHQRGERDTIITRLVRVGSVRLDPPGIDLPLDEVLGRAA